MGKPFDPFADDDLEFVPESEPTTIAPFPQREDSTRVLDRTQVDAPPPSRPAQREQPLRLDFSELADQGGDVRGASAIGSDSLAGDEFLTDIKKRDLEEALQKARLAQVALPIQQDEAEPRIVRKVRTPLYVLAGVALAFIALLVAGGFVFKAWVDRNEQQRLNALEHAKSAH